MVNLLDIPDLPLLHILLYLDCESLISLSSVCRRLREFVDLDKVWFKYVVKREDRLSFFNSCTLKSCCEDQCYDLPLRRKYFIARRISCDDCGRRRVMKQFRSTRITHVPRYGSGGDPRLSKCGSKVWLAYNRKLKKLQFADAHDCVAPMSETSYADTKSDVCRIAHWNDFVTACYENGQLLVWNSEKHEAPIDCQQVTNSILICCDFDKRMIAVGSGDQTLTVYRMDAESKTKRVWSANTAQLSYKMDPHVVAFRPCDAAKLFVSSYVFMGEPYGGDVSIYDVQTGAVDRKLLINSRNYETCHAAHWETFTTLITVGSTSNCVKIWDLRTDSCVAQWSQPIQGDPPIQGSEPMYLTAVRGDCSNAVVIGGITDDLIRLLDRRRFTEPVRSWETVGGQKVYAIAVDMTHICFALYNSINAIDFNY